MLILSVGALPLKTRLEAAGGGPTIAIVILLASSVGLPYFALSATSPLLQSWLAASRGEHFPYRLFALSNAASLLALLAYPVAIEPLLPTRLQMVYWSGGYVALLFLLAAVAVGKVPQARPVVSEGRPWLWIALAACASTLWLAIANYLGQQVGAMPFLWVVPMAIYLLSFILCFEADGWYRPALFRWLMPVAWIAICSRIALEGSAGGLQWEIPIFSAALFICCMFCHGELARSKPPAQKGLAFFYLMVAAGGALGGVFVGLIAPNLFTTFLELPLGVTASVFLAFYFLFGYRSPRRLIRLGVVAALAFVVSTQYHGERRVVRTRNFYGTLEVRESGEGDAAVRALYSGRTIHGLEFLSPALQRTPTTYYGVQSGAGLVLEASRSAGRRVAIVGLGAGTLATYGRSGDFFRFYEINPAVIRAATESFDFLRDSAAATDVVTRRWTPDARSRAAAQFRHRGARRVLGRRGSGSPADAAGLRSVFRTFAPRRAAADSPEQSLPGPQRGSRSARRELRKDVLRIHSDPDPAQRTEPADWAIVAANRDDLAALRPYAQPPSQRRVRPWTDEYSSLFQLWK